MVKVKIPKTIILTVIILLGLFAIISCGLFTPWTEIIRGAGIFGDSRYGEAIFGDENKGTTGDVLKSIE